MAVLRGILADVGEVDVYGDDGQSGLEAVLDAGSQLPEDVPLGTMFAQMRRQMAEAEGMDHSRFSDDDLLVGQDWNIFPNITTPLAAGGAALLRFRPYGTDPEVCTIDVLTLARLPESHEPPKMVERQFFSEWADHDGWGKLFGQDFSNIPNIQRGMHARSYRYHRCGRQDGNVVNFHKGLMRYIDGDDSR
jgi:hypothetical protein